MPGSDVAVARQDGSILGETEGEHAESLRDTDRPSSATPTYDLDRASHDTARPHMSPTGRPFLLVGDGPRAPRRPSPGDERRTSMTTTLVIVLLTTRSEPSRAVSAGTPR